MTTKNIRTVLLEKALALEIQAAKIRAFIRNADKENFDWQNVDAIQISSIQMILDIKLEQEQK